MCACTHTPIYQLTHTHTHTKKNNHPYTHPHHHSTYYNAITSLYLPTTHTLYKPTHTNTHAHTYCILQKERNNNKKIVRHFLKKKMQRTFMVCLWICAGKVLLFAKHTTILANAPQFGETRRIFMEKVPQSLEKCNNPWIAVLYKTVHFQE